MMFEAIDLAPFVLFIPFAPFVPFAPRRPLLPLSPLRPLGTLGPLCPPYTSFVLSASAPFPLQEKDKSGRVCPGRLHIFYIALSVCSKDSAS